MATNEITRIDEEIGNCILLVSSIVYYYMHLAVSLSFHVIVHHLKNKKEEIIANDNQVQFLPKSIVRLFVLSVLDLRNNRLTTLNTELSRLVSLLSLV